MNSLTILIAATISIAHVIKNHVGDKGNQLLDLKLGQTVRVLSKSAGNDPLYWGGEVSHWFSPESNNVGESCKIGL